MRTEKHVRRGLADPSKFSSKCEGSFVIREANTSGYYRLAKMDGEDQMDPMRDCNFLRGCSQKRDLGAF